MRVRVIKFVALLFTSAAALAFSNAFTLETFTQWIIIEREKGASLVYDLNSPKSLANGVKQIDMYFPRLRMGDVE